MMRASMVFSCLKSRISTPTCKLVIVEIRTYENEPHGFAGIGAVDSVMIRNIKIAQSRCMFFYRVIGRLHHPVND